MNRKILSLLAALLLCLNFFPVQSLEDEALIIGAPQVMDSGNPEKKALSFEAAPVMDSGNPEEDSKDPNAGLCPHHPVHTEACGYVAAEDGKAGTPCTFDCVICNIQALIDALPDEVTEENRDEVRTRLDEILALFGELSEQEQELVNLTRCLTLQAALDPDNAAAFAQSPITVPLDFTNVGTGNGQTPAQGAGYQWSGDAASGYFLELDNFQMELAENTDMTNSGPTAICFPNKGKTTISVKGQNTINAPGWNVFRAKLTNHSSGDKVDEDSILMKGMDDSAALIIEKAATAVRATYALEIQNLKIQATTTKSGISSYNEGVILEKVDYQNENNGKSAACIYSPNGSVNIKNSKLNLQCKEDMGIFARDGNLMVLDSQINISAGYQAGIAVAKSSGGSSRTATFSGNTKVTSVCTSLYGIYVQGDLKISSPVQVSTKGSSAALAIFDGITLDGIAVTSPAKGIITTPQGSSNIHTVRVEDIVATDVEIKPVELTVTPDKTEYQQGDAVQVTVTADLDLADSTISLYNGEKLIGTGNLGSLIALDTTQLLSGNQTLIAKLAENKGSVSKEFTIIIKSTSSISSLPTASLEYGKPLSASVLTGGEVIDSVSKKSIKGTWSWKDGTIIPTMENDGYTAVFTPMDITRYDAMEQNVKPTVTPKPLTVTSVVATNRSYNGTNQVQITGVTLDGKVGSDDVSVNTAGLAGTVNGTNAGKYTAVTLPVLTLTGTAAGKYTLTQPSAAVNTNVTISKAPALTPKSGNLAVSNKQANTYTYSLGALLPDVPKGMSLGSPAVTYALGTVSLGSYYTRGAVIDGETLTLPIQKVDSEDAKEIGTVTVIIHSGNYEDMTGTLHVRSVNQILPVGAPVLSADSITYGQSIGAITLSGTMRDTVNNKDVPGTFIWSNPDDRPAVQEKYTAAWTFTPQDNETYAVVTGTASIQVLPAPITDAVIELEPAAFRYDGAVHYPKIDSVKLDDTILTADVDYTAEIPQEREPGTYTVTITGKGSYTGTATVTFTINEVKTGNITLPDGTSVLLSVETGLSSVPAGLQNTPFRTISAIKKEMQTKVTAALSDTNGQIAIYDVRLQYKDKEDGEWKDVDSDHFPEDGVIAIIPYPNGTNGTDYIFTVQHMISHGANAGIVETLTYTALSDGLQCRFNSLSPVAVGYKAIEKKPSGSVESSSGGKGNSSSGKGGSGGSSSSNAQYDFWQQVRQKIGKAQPGDIVKVNARGYDKMPRLVMDALKKSDGVTLMIHWNGGKDITIDSDKALDEALRIYYPLSYLTDYDFGNHIEISSVNPLAGAYEDTAPLSSSDDYHFDNAANPKNSSNPSKQNPKTGGVWEINAPITAEAPLTIAGTPEITNAQRGLAETPELASQEVEKAIPGIYEPVEPADVPIQNGRNSAFPMVLVFLLAAACGGAWVWKSRFRNSKNS